MNVISGPRANYQRGGIGLMSGLAAHQAGNVGALIPDPAALGASLLGFWDAERPDLFTAPAGVVSSWKDTVGAYDAVQATEANKPIWSATSFNGRPGVTFDGTNDELTASYPVSFPTGATAGEIWVLTDQQALGADATLRSAAGLGNGTSGGRHAERLSSSSINRANARIGDGASKTSSVTTIVFSGRHVLRVIADGANGYAEIDGARSAGVAVVPTTTGSRVRLGANAAASAGSFWQGVHSAILFTSLLSATQASQIYAYLSRRL